LEHYPLHLYNGTGALVYRTDLQGTIVVTGQRDSSFLVNADPVEPEFFDQLPPNPLDPATPTFDPYGSDRDCSDFSSQAKAQMFYDAAGPGVPTGWTRRVTGFTAKR